jgi:group I intron endonuclease
MNSGIYKWTSPSGKCYIGLASNLERRKREFLTNPINYIYTSRNSAIDNARRKYSDFTLWRYEILEYCKVEDLKNRERYYIEKFNTTNSKIGYNSTKGGDGTFGIKWTAANYQAIKNRRSYEGSENPNYGKHHTQEAKEKIRKARIGRRQSEECRTKKSKAILQYSLDNVFIKEWISATEAMRALNIDKSSIGRVAMGKKRSAGGFIWKYKN